MHKPTILIVEDDPEISTILRRVLMTLYADYDIITASDANEGLEHVQQRRIVLIIADYNLPGMSGLEMIRQAKVVQPDMRILVVSAYLTGPLSKTFDEDKMIDAYLPKPFGLEILESRIEALLSGAKL